MRRKPPAKKKPSKDKEKEQPLLCYEYKRPGHFKADCPQLKEGAKKSKKKTVVATLNDSDGSSSDDENHEVANFCLMVHENKVTFENTSNFTFDKLQEAFNDLLDDL